MFMVQERERRLLGLLKRYGHEYLQEKKIAEIGCGTGYWLREFIKWGARPENVLGIDLLPSRVAEASRLCPAGVNIICGNAAALELDDATYDLVLQSTVFTSILNHEMRQQVASEMIRIMKPDGIIIWYDYHVNNPLNPDVQGVKRREIYGLFAGCRIKLERITLAPPIARRLAPHSWFACYLLERIPWLCTHYLGVVWKTNRP
jgi:ubiquinone/menaquinone biosynthesis C-methylase UbiE